MNEHRLEEEGVRVRDVAEVSGLPEEAVAAQVRQIRGEAGLRPPEGARSSALPWLAGASLLVAVGVTTWRLHPEAFVAPPIPNLGSVRRNPSFSPLTGTSTSDAEPLPMGLKAVAIGQEKAFTADSPYEAWKRAIPYPTAVDRLTRSTAALVRALSREERDDARAAAGTRYMSFSGETVEPRRGFARVSLYGWAGVASAWVARPLTTEGERDLRALAERFLAKAKGAQDEALAIPTDTLAGVVGPPPGFSIRFAGRRFDFREGPRLAFSDVSPERVARRLESAMLNAAYRDRRPPVGSWSGDPALDARTPVPDVSRVEIRGPDGLIVGDVPTAAGGEAATRRAIQALAARAARGIEGVNQRGRASDANP